MNAFDPNLSEEERAQQALIGIGTLAGDVALVGSLVSALPPRPSPQGVIVDVGPGPRPDRIWPGANVVVEYDAEIAQTLAQNLAAEGNPAAVVIGDALQLPLADGVAEQISYVYPGIKPTQDFPHPPFSSSNVMQTLGEAYRVLGPGGQLVVVVPGFAIPYVIPAIEQTFGTSPTITMEPVFGHKAQVIRVVK